MSCHPSAVRQVKSRFALPRRLGPFPSRLAPSEPPCRALFTLHSLHIVSGIAIGKTGMFPSSRTPEGLTPDSLGSSSVACRLGCLLRKLSQTRARPTRPYRSTANQRGDTPGFLALPLPIARQLEPAGTRSAAVQRPSRSPSLFTQYPTLSRACPAPSPPLLPMLLLWPGWPCACRCVRVVSFLFPIHSACFVPNRDPRFGTYHHRRNHHHYLVLPCTTTVTTPAALPYPHRLEVTNI